MWQIDAALITNHKLTQKEEKVVQMQNGKSNVPSAPAQGELCRMIDTYISGCICCTLRADLLEEIATLAEAGLYE